MRIDGFHAGAFGTLLDTGVTGLSPGLTVVTGHNGAGKSSLHALLVRVLFGYPTELDGDRRRHFAPVDGRNLDATVELLDDEGGTWSVRRRKYTSPALQVDRPDGSTTTSQEAVALLLPGLDGDTYERLFAIDIDQLLRADDLPPAELQAMLFDMLTLRVSRSLRGAATQARERADVLYLRRGRKQPVAEARAERDRLRSELADAQGLLRDLAGDRARLAELAATRDGLRDDMAELDRRRRLLQRVGDQWPAFAAARDAEAAAASLTGPDVPVELRAGRARAIDEVVDARDRLAQVERRVAVLHDERAALGEPDSALDAVADDVRARAAGLEMHRDRLQRLARSEEAARLATRTAEDSVATVGVGMDAEAVRAVAVDGDARARLRDVVEAATVASAAARAGAETVAEAGRAVQRHEESQAALAPPEVTAPDPADVAARRAALDVLRAQLPVLDHADAAAADRARALAALATASSSGASPSPRLGFALLGLGAVALVVALVVAVAVVAVGGALLLAAGAWSLAAARARSPVTGALPSLPPPPDDVIAAARAAVARAADLLGLPQPPSRADLAQAEQLVRHDEETRQARVGAMARDQEAVTATRDAQRRLGEAEDDLTRLDELARTADRTALGLARSLGLPDAGEVRLLPALHERVAEASGRLAAAADARTAVDELRDPVRSWIADLRRLLDAAGRPVPDDVDPVDHLPVLLHAVDRDAATRTQHGALDARARELDTTRERNQRALTAAEEVLFEVRAALGAADEATVDRAIDEADQRAALHAAAAADRVTVERALGEGDVADAARTLLATGDVVGWDAELAEAGERRASLSVELEQVVGQHTLLEDRLVRLVEDDTVPRLALRLEQAEERLRDEFRRWGVAEVAAGLLAAARDHFERDQAPVVLERASHLLADISLGALTSLQHDDDALLAIRGGVAVPVHQLSTGERAQLYLALRVALADEQPVRAPLLLDDLLGGLDDDRADAVVAALGALTVDRQVLLFTASERTAVAARAALPGAGLLRLAHGRVVESDPGAARGA
jgi:uncharacterized protein YhaN